MNCGHLAASFPLKRKGSRCIFFKIAIAALSALILDIALLPIAANAQTAPPGMVRTWNAVSPSIVHLTIAQTPGSYTVNALGSCHPTACNMGTRNLMIFGPNVSAPVGTTGMATFVNGFSVMTLTVRYLGPNALRVQSLTHFTDNSGRKNYTVTEQMH